MAAVVTTETLAPFGNKVARSTALLALWAGVDNEKIELQGIQHLMLVDPSVNAMYDNVLIDARIAAI